MTEDWRYKGPIFDAHTHIGTSENVDRMVKVEEDFGVNAQIGIVHAEEELQTIRTKHSARFVFAKYLSLTNIAHFEVNQVLDEIQSIKPNGYSLAKMWFGPRWRDYV